MHERVRVSAQCRLGCQRKTGDLVGTQAARVNVELGEQLPVIGGFAGAALGLTAEAPQPSTD